MNITDKLRDKTHTIPQEMLKHTSINQEQKGPAYVVALHSTAAK